MCDLCDLQQQIQMLMIFVDALEQLATRLETFGSNGLEGILYQPANQTSLQVTLAS